MRRISKKTRRRIIRDIRLLLVCAAVAACVILAGHFRGEKETSSQPAPETAESSREEKEASQEGDKPEETEKTQSWENGHEENPLGELQETLEEMIAGQKGQWSIYVKDLEEDLSFSIQSRPLYAASLIKLFVMEKTFLDFEQTSEHQETGTDGTDGDSQVLGLLENMIERSDNESFNELVRLQSSDRDFAAGCVALDQYLAENGYKDTVIYHTLNPSATGQVSIADKENCTSVEDCGILLEKIYRGTCVSPEDSVRMQHLLLGQEVQNKIPQGVPKDVKVANKTGETDEVQHDAAIVYGPEKDYILCVMSEDSSGAGSSIQLIRKISRVTYEYLNP